MAGKRTKIGPSRGNNITRCPTCGETCRSLKSSQVTKQYREITYLCTDEACAHIFVAEVAVVRTLSPSKRPERERPPDPLTT